MLTRLRLLSFAFFIIFCALIARLFYWQVVKGESLARLARQQYKGGSTIIAPRGNILASDGTWLAATKSAWLMYATIPNITEDKEKLAEKITSYLIPQNMQDKKTVLEETMRINNLLNKKNSVWVPISRKLDSETKDKLSSLKTKGIGFEEEEIRDYPEGSVAAQLLGFVGKNENGEDQGYFGLEGYYDFMLTGKPGFLSREADARGVPILFSDNSKEISAVNGVDLVTNIDKTVQLFSEQRLKRGIEKYGASGGSVIVMNPKTGAILGMASFPSFDPKKYSEFEPKLFTNPVISSTFEPGSIFKIIVMASALDAGVVKPDTVCPVCDKPYKVDEYFIKTWNNEYNPDQTMTDVIVHSDNVGMSYAASLIGKDKMYDYLEKFGIGKLTDIDLQGEATAKLRKKGTWSDVDLATASFGQGVAVTPIQLAKAAAVIANKGVSVTPFVVSKLHSDKWEKEVSLGKGERIISEKAAGEITGMMVEAARRGESKWTDNPGFRVAGKTGTAQIPIAGHYDESQTIASFVGFAPFDNPKFVMLVTLEKPQSSPWASETAAPLWYSIAKDLFNYYGIQPS